MPRDKVKEILTDPEFFSLRPSAQVEVLSIADPEFAGLLTNEKLEVIRSAREKLMEGLRKEEERRARPNPIEAANKELRRLGLKDIEVKPPAAPKPQIEYHHPAVPNVSFMGEGHWAPLPEQTTISSREAAARIKPGQSPAEGKAAKDRSAIDWRKVLPADVAYVGEGQWVPIPGYMKTGQIDPGSQAVSEIAQAGLTSFYNSMVPMSLRAAGGLLSTLAYYSPTVEIADALKEVGDAFERTASKAEISLPKEIAERISKDPIDDPSALLDPLWWSHGLGNVMGSMVPIMAPSLAAARLAGGVAQLAHASPFARSAMAAVYGTGAASLVETMFDAGLQYREAIELGASPETAAQVAVETVRREFPVTASFNLAGLFNPAIKGAARRALASLFAEGLQEAGQGVAQRSAMEDVAGIDQDVWKPAFQEFLLAAIGGAAAGPVVEAAVGKDLGAGVEQTERAPVVDLKRAPLTQAGEARERIWRALGKETATWQMKVVELRRAAEAAETAAETSKLKSWDIRENVNRAIELRRSYTAELKARKTSLSPEAWLDYAGKGEDKKTKAIFRVIGEPISQVRKRFEIYRQAMEIERQGLVTGPSPDFAFEVAFEGPLQKEIRPTVQHRRAALRVFNSSWESLSYPQKLAIDRLVQQRRAMLESRRALRRQMEQAATPQQAQQVAQEQATQEQAAPGEAARGGEPETAPAPAEEAEPATRGPRRPQKQPAYGHEVDISVPGESTKYAARYSLRELSDIYPSHNPFTFEPNPDYYYQNERNYSADVNAARVVDRSTDAAFDPAYLVTESPTGEHGPPIIDPEGNVLGGNARTMILTRVYQSNGPAADRYRQALSRGLARFGIDPQELERFENPVLVREVPGADAARVIRDTNKASVASLTRSEQAIADARALTPRAIELIRSKIERAGAGATVAEALEGQHGQDVLEELIRAGVVTRQETAQLLNPDGTISILGRMKISNMLVGRLFDDPRDMDLMPPSISSRVERIAIPAMMVEGDPEWDIRRDIQGAVRIISEFQSSSLNNIEDWLAQADLSGQTPFERFGNRAIAIARKLLEGQRAALRAFRSYAHAFELARGASGAFFAPDSAEAAFEQAFSPEPDVSDDALMGVPWKGAREPAGYAYSPELVNDIVPMYNGVPFEKNESLGKAADHSRWFRSPRTGVFYLNRHAMHLVTETVGNWEAGEIIGLALPSSRFVDIAAGLTGYHHHPRIKVFLNELKQQMDAAGGVALVDTSEQINPYEILYIVQEELSHLEQLKLENINRNISWDKIYSSPEYQKAAKNLIRNLPGYAPIENDSYELMMEVVARLTMSSGWSILGLSPDEAMHLSLLYVKTLAENYGENAQGMLRYLMRGALENLGKEKLYEHFKRALIAESHGEAPEGVPDWRRRFFQKRMAGDIWVATSRGFEQAKTALRELGRKFSAGDTLGAATEYLNLARAIGESKVAEETEKALEAIYVAESLSKRIGGLAEGALQQHHRGPAPSRDREKPAGSGARPHDERTLARLPVEGERRGGDLGAETRRPGKPGSTRAGVPGGEPRDVGKGGGATAQESGGLAGGDDRGRSVGQSESVLGGKVIDSWGTTQLALKKAKANLAKLDPLIQKHLYPYQQAGIITMAGALWTHGGALLADGPGTGKTAQILGLAKEFAKMNRKVLIVSMAEAFRFRRVGDSLVPTGSYEEWIGKLDLGGIVDIHTSKKPVKLAPGRIALATYNAMLASPPAVDSDTLLIFDEAHALKNMERSKRGLTGLNMAREAGYVLYATATPYDRPQEILYLERLKPFGDGVTMEEGLRRDIGLARVKTRFGERWAPAPGMTWRQILQNKAEVTRDLFLTGKALRRELKMTGVDIYTEWIPLSPEAQHVMDEIELNFGPSRSKRMHQRRQIEPFKIPKTIELTKKELADGRSVIIFVARVNWSRAALKWFDDRGNEHIEVIVESEGTARSLKSMLIEAGIPEDTIAELHGGSEDDDAAKAVEEFRSNRKRVMIATVESGGTGINLDDTTGNAPRTIIMVTAPFSGLGIVQSIHRGWRATTKSDLRVIYLRMDHEVDDWSIGISIEKMKVLGAVVHGRIERMGPDVVDRERQVLDAQQAKQFLAMLEGRRPKSAPAVSDKPPKSEWSMAAWADWLRRYHPEVRSKPENAWFRRRDLVREFTEAMGAGDIPEGSKPWYYPYSSAEEAIRELKAQSKAGERKKPLAGMRRAMVGDAASVPPAAEWSMESWSDWLKHFHPELSSDPMRAWFTRRDLVREFNRMIEEYDRSMIEAANMGPGWWSPYGSPQEALRAMEEQRRAIAHDAKRMAPLTARRGAGRFGRMLVASPLRFLASDLVPTIADAASAMKQVARDFLRIWSPSSLSPHGRIGAFALRRHMAAQARRMDALTASLEAARRVFERMDRGAVIRFIDAMENGERQANEDLDQIAQTLRQVLDKTRDEVRALGTGKLESFIENYFPHIWKDRAKAEVIAARFFGRRPLEGPKSFLKPRKYFFFTDGLDAGLEPVSWNPIDLVLMKVSEMGRYIMAHRFLNEMKKTGMVRFVPVDGRAPVGWRKIIDPIGTVYGRSSVTVRESPNRGLYSALEATAKALGIEHLRSQSEPRGMVGRAVGLAIPGEKQIRTQSGSAEQVIAHELGHIIDYLVNKDSLSMRDFFLNYPGGDTGRMISQAVKDLRSADRQTRARARQALKALSSTYEKRKAIAKELRALADERRGVKRSYARSAEEKMAAIVEAWVGAREVFQRVAPNVLEAWKQWASRIPELKPLMEIEGSMDLESRQEQVSLKGLLIKGWWYAPQSIALMLENHLKVGLRDNAIFRIAMAANNVMNMFQLSLSAFHLMNTALDSATTQLSLVFYRLAKGDVVGAAREASILPVAPIYNVVRGHKMLKEWYVPGSGSPDVRWLVHHMVLAGGRAHMSELYRTSFSKRMREAFHGGNYLGAIIRLPAAIVEEFSNITMEFVVPRMKLGAFAQSLSAKLAYLPPNHSRIDLAAAASEAWDVVEDRLGEVVYDNYFWNRYAKDMAHLLVRSVGWNLGSLRVMFRGAAEMLSLPIKLVHGKKPELTLAAAYLLALPMFTAFIGALVMKLLTGDWPETLEDYFFPRTGDIDEYGRPRRVSLPTYAKDIFHMAREPLKTITNKASPLVDLLGDMLTNRDFYGVKIRNEDDPLIKQLQQVADRVAEQFMPFGVREAIRAHEEQAMPRHLVLPFFGMVPAPAVLGRTKAERLAQHYISQKAPHGGRTTEQAIRSRGVRALARSIRLGKEPSPPAREAIAGGYMTPDDIRRAVKESGMHPLDVSFQMLTLEEALRVWAVATREERSRLAPLLQKKVRTLPSLPPAQATRILDLIREMSTPTGEGNKE